MNDRRFIKPRDGLTVRDHVTQRELPSFGAGVPWDGQWQRRLNDQDVEPTTEEAVLAGEKAAEAAQKKAARSQPEETSK